ncbi:MAG: hypothetical protein QOE45_2476 [Frankiaceae bacterium]|jgi:hypothetical protein|nr:hypothetical protein [Frankiaceae bacterium]
MNSSRGLRVLIAAGLVAAAVGAGGGVAAGSPPWDDLPKTHGLPVDPDLSCPTGDDTVLLDPDDGRQIDLDVLVLLDGVDPAHAASVFADVTLPYAELNLRVVPTYQVADPPFTGTDTIGIINQARALFPDREVPAEYDMVEVLTSKNVTYLGDAAVAGQAYCVGGVSDRTWAYEVSEAGPPPTPSARGVGGPSLPDFGAKKAAKVTAHEMGHLFGGEHQYANCAESFPCTLMFYEANLISLHFGTVNGRIVRGYAVRFAAANDAT